MTRRVLSVCTILLAVILASCLMTDEVQPNITAIDILARPGPDDAGQGDGGKCAASWELP